MVPLSATSRPALPEATGPRLALALGHALRHDRRRLRADHPERPTSLLWLRSGDDGAVEAFGVGAPGPALDWLSDRCDGPAALLAPESWGSAARSRFGPVATGRIRTLRWRCPVPLAPSSACRSLMIDDETAFLALAPPWALRGWADFATMLAQTPASGIASGRDLLALAWGVEADGRSCAAGVFVAPRYRRLGLGRAVAGRWVASCAERGYVPIWVAATENAASLALARSLGFGGGAEEIVWRLPARIAAESSP